MVGGSAVSAGVGAELKSAFPGGEFARDFARGVITKSLDLEIVDYHK